MRSELELIEKIEAYLDGALSGLDKADFEQAMAADPTLRENVRLQSDIRASFARSIRLDAVRAARGRYKRWNRFKNGGLAGGIGLLAIVAAITLWPKTAPVSMVIPANPASPLGDDHIPAQQFILDPTRDTVIETNGGMTVAIAAHSFTDTSGTPAGGLVRLTVREALDPSSIMRAGLSTYSGTQPLETGGMFDIEATGERGSLKIGKPLYAEVPTDTVKPGMQLYQGVRGPDGRIDWKTPRPLERDPVPVDILGLDFYPPGYIDSLRSWGYPYRDKRYTDSLYYSFAASLSGNTYPERSDSLARDATAGDTTASAGAPACGINPASIKAIWNRRFQNTLLSTREFEQRMPWIHRTHDSAILDLYVDNLDLPLYEIDSMAAARILTDSPLRQKFAEFAARKDGKVKTGGQAAALRAYYDKKRRLFAGAIARTQDAFWNEQRALDDSMYRRTQRHAQDEAARQNGVFEKELEANTKYGFAKAGYDTTRELPRLTTGPYYRVSVTVTGWCNIDRAVAEATLDRTTLRYQSITIRYLPVTFQVADAHGYDRVYAYLIPDGSDSFLRMTDSSGTFTDKMDELIHYSAVCIAYKGSQAYFYTQGASPGMNGPIVPAPISEEALTGKLNALKAGMVLQDYRYWLHHEGDKKRTDRNEQLLELRNRIEVMIFPCHEGVR